MRPLLSVDDALALVLGRVPAPRAERVFLAEAAGRVLAESVSADRDYPAFPRSRVDGYAVRADDAREGAELPVAFEVPAGAPPPSALPPGAAARIFTGAAAPDGADAIVMQEDCTAPAPGRVAIGRAARAGEHLVPVGHECRVGEPVAAVGTLITPSVIGALASIGAAHVLVAARPRVRVVATGDEIVPVDETPPPGCIRNSNAPSLAAAARAFGGLADGEFHAGDTRAVLDAVLERALDGGDICLLTGGVSVGDYDLVPPALEDAGVERVFHGVRLQPGKPLWFGVRGRTLVFGLPGNPVSSLVTATLFARPAVRRLLGLPADPPGPRRGVLGSALRGGVWRRRFDPVRLEYRVDGAIVAHPVRFRGSGDVFGFAAADALAVVPEDSPALPAGHEVALVPLPSWGP